ncbi:MAG: SRPBCC family protein [Flavobacteriales bacterium]|nr:SRPBCC family protein [Flavobacteriales bacterium]
MKTNRKNLLVIILTFPITLSIYIYFFTGNLQFTEEIVINSDIKSVTELLGDPNNMIRYMEGIESYNVIKGDINQIGTEAEIVALMGDEKIKMTEVVIVNNLPTEKKVTYSTDGVYNIVTNKLEVITLNKTRLINNQDFEFKGYMKIISFFMPSAFKKQSRIILESFKNFAEKRNNNLNQNN